MSGLKNIVWLASYPKSGNTWTRIFLANYLMGGEEPVPINQVHRLGIGDAIAKTYQVVGKGQYDPNDRMRHLQQRERVLMGIANNGADINFVKTHNENGKAFGTTLVPQKFTRSAVYIVRDPRDMVLSYARHYGMTVDRTIEAISRRDNATKADNRNVEQYIGTWSNHIKSWTGSKRFPVHLLRYEDMQNDPRTTFSGLLSFLAVPIDPVRLDRAIEHSSFNAVRAQEDKSDFIERSENAEKFFHTGTSGHWRESLTDEQAAAIADRHGDAMRRHGYL